LDATLIQKQDSPSLKNGHPYAVVLILFVFNPSFRLAGTYGINAPSVWHAGRDVLLQACVLRI
jgi:hypothetical protein